MINSYAFKWKHCTHVTQSSDIGSEFTRVMSRALGENPMLTDICSKVGFPNENARDKSYSSSIIGANEYTVISLFIPIVGIVG